MIYFAEAVGVGHIKIGFTAGDDAACRLESLQTGSPVPIRLLGTLPGTADDEKDLHRRFGAARVCGEWFKPVPELVALIGTPEGRVCGATAIVTKSVQIKVLTVGRKQFTKSLLDQLPEKSPVDWPTFRGDLAKAIRDGVSRDFEWSYYVEVDSEFWGWVEGGEAIETTWEGARLARHRRWVIWQVGNCLYKYAWFERIPDAKLTGGKLGLSQKQLDEYRHTFREFNAYLFENVPGWSDQLFIGV
jgi:hypothetical protein